MPGRTAKYNKKIDGELKMRVLDVLNNASDTVNPTLDWIKQQDMALAPHTTQKLSRILGSLVEMGLVKKGKLKSTGRMVYRLTSRMEEDGYEVDEDIVEQAGFGVTQRPWNGMDWELEDMLMEEE